MTRADKPIFIAIVAAICLAMAPAAKGQERLAPAFAGSYQLSNIGTPAGVPTPFGGLTFLDANTVLLGGAANSVNGAIYAIGVTRDGSNHVTGFSGTATLFATAPQIDGGLAFGPGGVLFFTTYPSNTMGEIKANSSSPDKSVKLADVGVTGSTGSLQFAPNGDLKVLSYSAQGFYTVVLAADGSGTYDVTSATLNSIPAGGPEGLFYVPPGSPLFVGNNVLICQYTVGAVSAYAVDASYDPILGSRQDFVLGLNGAEGATIDPLTNDFLFSTFGGTSHIDVVSGFAVTHPVVTLSPASLKFAGMLLGATSAAKNVQLTNSGAATLTITGLTASGNFAETDNCSGQTLPPSGSCTISVTFTPSVKGSVPGALTITDNALNSPQILGLSGSGLPSLSVSPASMNFGGVTVGTNSPLRTATLTNNTTGSLSYTFLASGNYSAVGSGTKPCIGVLAGKKKCTISAVFSPTANGATNGLLAVSSADFPTQVGSLSGTGLGGGPAPLTFSPTSFGSTQVGTSSAPKTVTVTNSSGSAVNITDFVASAEYSVTGSGAIPCGGTVGAGASCTVAVTFSPSVAGTIKGSVTFMDNAPINTQVVNLSGKAVLPVTFAPASLKFNAQTVGTTSGPKTVTLTNNQAVALNLASTVASGQFAASSGGNNSCGSTVNAHSSCTFAVRFTPAQTGAIGGVVTVTHDASGSPQELKLSGTGQ